jgi:predicted MPP superfamily phosphohydrolase
MSRADMAVRASRAALALGGAAAAGLAWGHFEAGWVRLARLDVELPGLPPELDGIRIAHLSDFHLGLPSRGLRAVERAARWTAELAPDLVVLTGDLVSHPRGMPKLREVLSVLPPSYAVLGNHDYGVARDPFAERTAPVALPHPHRLLGDEAVDVELRGRRVQLVGVDSETFLGKRARPAALADPAADLRILLCHYPQIVNKLPPGSFDLVLAGHLHDGQITIPYPGGKLRLAHPRFPYPRGIYRRPAAVLHVSPGLGTTFVPFRFCARPEATELVLRAAPA